MPANFIKVPTAIPKDKINGTEKLKFVLEKVEYIVCKGEKSLYQYFLFFLQCFLNVSFTGSLKVRIVW